METLAMHVARHFLVSSLALTLTVSCSSIPKASHEFQEGGVIAAIAPPSGVVTVSAGKRTVDDLDFSAIAPGLDLSDQTGFGIEFASIGDSGFGFEVGILFAGADETDATGLITVESYVIETAFGGRYTYTELGPFYPYVGAGLDVVTGFADVSGGGITILASNVELGGYAHGGLLYVIGGGLTLGVDVRTLFGTDEQDYVQLAGSIGWAF